MSWFGSPDSPSTFPLTMQMADGGIFVSALVEET
jgi:hypothetical protein